VSVGVWSCRRGIGLSGIGSGNSVDEQCTTQEEYTECLGRQFMNHSVIRFIFVSIKYQRLSGTVSSFLGPSKVSFKVYVQR